MRGGTAWLVLLLIIVIIIVSGCDKSSEQGSSSSRPVPEPEAVAGAANTPDSAQSSAAKPDPPPKVLADQESIEEAEVDPLTLGPEASLSIGAPAQGSLQTSVALPLRGPGFRFAPSKDPGRRHGTVDLVQALIRAAQSVDDKLPGGTATIGDLSLAKGGPIGGHASHQAGRDVDLMFYLLDDKGQPFPSKAIPLEPDGRGTDYKDLTTAADDVGVRLDVPRTWSFVEALVSDEANHIHRIFVVEHVRALLLAHAKRIGAPKAARQRFGHVTCQPRFPHDDHMHIRFYCAPDDIERGCLDSRPLFPWHKADLARRQAKAVFAGRRTAAKPKLTSVAGAEKKARERLGSFDPAVDAFLERRKTWAKRPHPGRKYCK